MIHAELPVDLFQLLIGWMWIVPLFHLRQPPSTKGERTTVLLERSEVDFPLGYGALLVDVELTFGWDIETLDEELPREPRSGDGQKTEPGTASVLAAISGNVEALQATRD